MKLRPITATPSQVMVDQLVASGINYVFYNSGSREALFFDALEQNPNINGILALHEGSVASMAGGYTQVNVDPAVMVVHLGAGLAQCMGQLINIWSRSLPVVVITFAGDVGSFADKVVLDLTHNAGPTSIAAPMTKANWTVIDPIGLPNAIHRAIQVAKTPPMGPVHIAVYDHMLGHDPVTTNIIEGGIPELKGGYPSDDDVAAIGRALDQAHRPLLYVGEGVWQNGGTAQVTALAECFGLPIASRWGERRSVSMKHPLFCGRNTQAINDLNPDLILCMGVRHDGRGNAQDLDPFAGRRVIAVGAGGDNLKIPQGTDMAILADEGRTAERIIEWFHNSFNEPSAGQGRYEGRRHNMLMYAEGVRASVRETVAKVPKQADYVRPWVLSDTLDRLLEERCGGIVTIEQYAAPLDMLGGEGGNNVYLGAAGASEGYGMGAAVGAKLAAPDRPLVGLVGDGSFCYADSALWTAAHHSIPLLYIIPNNQAYGVVAQSFKRAEGRMAETGIYAGVALTNIDPVKVAEGFNVEGMTVNDEEQLEAAIVHGLDVVEGEKRPYLLNVQLPSGLPEGGKAAKPFSFAETLA